MRIASVVLGLVLTVAVVPAAVSASDVTGQVVVGQVATVDKSQYTPGENMTLTGSGFSAFVPVSATIVPSAPGFPKTGTTNGSGVVSWTFPAPPVGDYTVTITQTGFVETSISAVLPSASTGFKVVPLATTTTTMPPTTTTVPVTTTTIVGGGGPIPTTVPATTVPATTSTTVVGSAGALPATGSPVSGTVRAATVAVFAGIGLVMVSTRRRRSASQPG
ncbi:MAG: hypothetical protein ACOYL9_13655 [Ilumatobacteraceae bacterium]